MALLISPPITGEASPRLALCGERRGGREAGRDARRAAGLRARPRGHKVFAAAVARRGGPVRQPAAPSGRAGPGGGGGPGAARPPPQLTCSAGGAGGGGGPASARLPAPLPLAEITLNTCRSPPVSLQALARPPVNQAGAPPRRGSAVPQRRAAAAADTAPERGRAAPGEAAEDGGGDAAGGGGAQHPQNLQAAGSLQRPEDLPREAGGAGQALRETHHGGGAPRARSGAALPARRRAAALRAARRLPQRARPPRRCPRRCPGPSPAAAAGPELLGPLRPLPAGGGGRWRGAERRYPQLLSLLRGTSRGTLRQAGAGWGCGLRRRGAHPSPGRLARGATPAGAPARGWRRRGRGGRPALSGARAPPKFPRRAGPLPGRRRPGAVGRVAAAGLCRRPRRTWRGRRRRPVRTCGRERGMERERERRERERAAAAAAAAGGAGADGGSPGPAAPLSPAPLRRGGRQAGAGYRRSCW